ncbi:hypothetical protein Bbelb_335000 [Branchiostoma belcheri]|nr:hypothetical protein Bbelb_335000 [Branchiostoma belcheri]
MSFLENHPSPEDSYMCLCPIFLTLLVRYVAVRRISAPSRLSVDPGSAPRPGKTGGRAVRVLLTPPSGQLQNCQLLRIIRFTSESRPVECTVSEGDVCPFVGCLDARLCPRLPRMYGLFARPAGSCPRRDPSILPSDCSRPELPSCLPVHVRALSYRLCVCGTRPAHDCAPIVAQQPSTVTQDSLLWTLPAIFALLSDGGCWDGGAVCVPPPQVCPPACYALRPPQSATNREFVGSLSWLVGGKPVPPPPVAVPSRLYHNKHAMAAAGRVLPAVRPVPSM